MAVTLAYPGYWYRDLDTGLDHQRTVHASESIAIHSTLPVEGTVVARPRVIEVVDKGRERGALVVSERDILDAVTRERLATVRQTALCRGDGGFSRAAQKGERPAPLPDRTPDRVLTLPTPLQAALIYRLSGDPNPLHVDPEFARAAGFPRPVLHGLATMGLICHAAVRLALGGAPERLRTMDCRFTAPVYPGNSIGCDFWRTGSEWTFRASVADRLSRSARFTELFDIRFLNSGSVYPTIGHLGNRPTTHNMTMQFDKLNVLSGLPDRFSRTADV